MASSPPPTTSVPTLTAASSSPAVDMSAHRFCHCCAKRMSSIKYDKHTLCLQCRNVLAELRLGAQSVVIGHSILCKNT